ncbi:MAG: VPLPA-CTERM sorting domain-containing protein [Lacipirellulaceae bacterium]
MTRMTIWTPAFAALLACAGVSQATTFSVVDAGGFEAPFTTTFNGTGQLEGQVPSTFNGTWLRTRGPGLGQAFIQTTTVGAGTQAVQVNKVANSDDFWGVPVDGYPALQYICIDWDMRVEQTAGPSGNFGPFFGVDAYDDESNPVARLGALGVDASTGDVVYIDQDGFVQESAFDATFGTWNRYRIILDYGNDETSLFFNGNFISTFDFVDGEIGLDEFTDANIAAFALGGDSASQALTGTAYFDNFTVVETSVNKIPEPAAGVLLLTGLAAVLRRRV